MFERYLFLQCPPLTNAIALLACGLLFLVFIQRKQFVLAALIVILASILDFMGGAFNVFSLVRFPLMWIVIVLEQIYPRNPYSLTGPESFKTASVFSFRQSLAAFVRYLAPAAFGTTAVFGLNLKESPVPFWMQVTLTALAADLAIYAIHRAQHHFGYYWKFHKLHHAAREITLLVNFRTHIFEAVFVQMGSRILLYQLLGVSADVKLASVLLAYTTGGMLAHANLDFPNGRWKWLNYILVTPNFHAYHHAREGNFCNYSEAFPIWDLLFGTFRMPPETISDFGIEDEKFAAQGLLAQHLDPLVGLIREPAL